MKEIELVPALELGNKLNVDVMDFPEADAPIAAPEELGCKAGGDGSCAPAGRRRKRCGITLEYAPRDIRQLQEQGMGRDAMLAFYRQRVYDLVKVNISQDWECVGGMDEVLAIVGRHLDAAL